MAKTADYTRRAVDNYRQKHDFVQIKLDKGAKEFLQNALDGMSVTAFCSQVVNDKVKEMQALADTKNTAERSAAGIK